MLKSSECVYEWPTLSVYDSEGSMKQNVPSDLVVVVMGRDTEMIWQSNHIDLTV